MSRALRWFLGIGALVSFGTIAAIFILIWFLPGPSIDEVARSQSPEGQFEAILVEINGGATTSFGYQVFVVPRHGKYSDVSPSASLYGAVRNENAYGANLNWVSPTELLVEFEQARSSKLDQSVVTVAGQAVRVELRPGITDVSAPPGGMLYNLRGGQ
jgi:hypothetical protein